MIRALVLAAALVALAAPEADAQARRSIADEVDQCPGESNPELLQCAVGILDREDARLNRVYRAALARLASGRQATLRAEQRRWIKDRDESCAAFFDDTQYGREASLRGTMCHAELTRDRADELERIARRSR